jgi:ubiquinone/menaquinone biosynthesis C-methylase UbiE
VRGLMNLTVPACCEDGIWYPRTPSADTRAQAVWSPVAESNPIRAAAATGDENPFAKYPEWIRPHFARRGGLLLDAGCGYGRVSIPLLKANPELRCIGVDASPVMLRRFVQLASEHRIRDRVELFCGNIDALPFSDGYFQYVLTCAVLLHVPKTEVTRIIAECHRVLDRGGTMIVAGSFPNVFNPESVTNLRNNVRSVANGPVRAYTRREVKGLFRGFSSIEVEAHQMIVLPRSIGSIPLPFARTSRKVNQYFTDHWINAFRRSWLLVNHHDVIALK